MTRETKATELHEADLDQAAGGFMIFPNGSNLKMGEKDADQDRRMTSQSKDPEQVIDWNSTFNVKK